MAFSLAALMSELLSISKGILTFADDIDDCLSNADAAIIMTEWEDYKKIK